MIGVVERGAAADVVEPADVARVVARNVVQAVARLQSRAGGGLMVHAGKHVGRVVAGRIVPVPTRGPGEPSASSAELSTRHHQRRDRHDAGAIELRPLDVPEPERPIPHERAAETQAELVLPAVDPFHGPRRRVLSRGERVPRVDPSSRKNS